jgi:CRP/FNR family transcriptional regulator, nitrogen oxide reductase regulator
MADVCPVWHDGGELPMTLPSETAEVVRQLDNIPLFKGLEDDVLSRVRNEVRTKAVGTGEFFFHEGEDSEAFFVLTSGRVKLTQLTPEGHHVVLRIIGAGDAFGGAGVFGDLTYPVGAEAVEPAVAFVWTSGAMRHFLETEPRIALNALEFVAGRLHDLQRRYRQLTTERVERRVARALLRLVQEAGRRVDAGVEIDFPVSRQDIAEMTGTTLYTVSRLLSSWEERGIIRSGRQRITLTTPHALVALAEDLPER